jgi:hypothetical protein
VEEAKADEADNFGCGQGKVYWRPQLGSVELYLLMLIPHCTQDSSAYSIVHQNNTTVSIIFAFDDKLQEATNTAHSSSPCVQVNEPERLRPRRPRRLGAPRLRHRLIGLAQVRRAWAPGQRVVQHRQVRVRRARGPHRRRRYVNRRQLGSLDARCGAART